jgi:hypothetical protein
MRFADKTPFETERLRGGAGGYQTNEVPQARPAPLSRNHRATETTRAITITNIRAIFFIFPSGQNRGPLNPKISV